MDTPRSWRSLVGFLADPSRLDQDNWHHLGEEAYSETRDLLALCQMPSAQWRKELGLVVLLRSLIAMIPAVALEQPDRPCRGAIEQRIRQLTGEPAEKSEVDALVRVVKRLQRYRSAGRRGLRASSFDRSSKLQARILRDQGSRCASCGYRFEDGDLEEDKSAGITSKIDAPLSEYDRSPPKIRRKAVLDHQLPVYLAGDSQNWQILCWTCNEGKSDMLFGIEAYEWFGRARFANLLTVRPRLRYMVLRRDGSCQSCSRTSRQAELRLMRKDRAGTDCYGNLKVVCRDYLLRGACSDVAARKKR